MAHSPSELLFFSIYLPGYDNALFLHGPLYDAKRRFFTHKYTVHSDGTAFISGVPVSFSGTIHKHSLSWEVCAGKIYLEKAYPCRGGYTILYRNLKDILVCKAIFSRNHEWLSSSYFLEGDSENPAVVLTPKAHDNQIHMQTFDPLTRACTSLSLYSCPAAFGTQTHSILNSTIGEPRLYAATSKGDFCYCPIEEVEKRNDLARQITFGTYHAAPVWPEEDPLEAELMPEEIPVPILSAKETDGEIEPTEKAVKDEVSAVVSDNYLYYGSLNENGQRDGHGRTAQPDGTTTYDGTYEKDQRHGFGVYYYKNGQPCYVGAWEHNLRQGLGISFRSDLNGYHIGTWKEDSPCGKSTIFDKDGNLRFSGQIENGKKEGLGIMRSAKDGSVFIGKWKNGVQSGIGSAFDAQGNLVYTGEWKNGKRHGKGTEFDENGKIVFTGEWRDGTYFDGIFMPE